MREKQEIRVRTKRESKTEPNQAQGNTVGERVPPGVHAPILL